jgi:O-methyltransferase involved in polyketide biosynthesis
MNRPLPRLSLEAAWRHPEPEAPQRHPAATALAGQALEEAQARGADHLWCQRRDQWHDACLRRFVIPGHARVILAGGGLDPRGHRLPPGMLGPGLLALLDRPEVLRARTSRLRAAQLQEPPQIQQVAADPTRPRQLTMALRVAGLLRQRAALLLWVGCANLAGLDGLEALLGSLRQLDLAGLRLAFDWIGSTARLPDAQRAALEPYGPPLPWNATGMDLWLRAQGAQDPQTTALLSSGPLQVGFGTSLTL